MNRWDCGGLAPTAKLTILILLRMNAVGVATCAASNAPPSSLENMETKSISSGHREFGRGSDGEVPLTRLT